MTAVSNSLNKAPKSIDESDTIQSVLAVWPGNEAIEAHCYLVAQSFHTKALHAQRTGFGDSTSMGR